MYMSCLRVQSEKLMCIRGLDAAAEQFVWNTPPAPSPHDLFNYLLDFCTCGKKVAQSILANSGRTVAVPAVVPPAPPAAASCSLRPCTPKLSLRPTSVQIAWIMVLNQ